VFAGIEGIANGIHRLASSTLARRPQPSQLGCRSKKIQVKLNQAILAIVGVQGVEHPWGRGNNTPVLLPLEVNLRRGGKREGQLFVGLVPVRVHRSKSRPFFR
jgi:hypothetical protein